jgi:hypothetical protein
MNSNCVEKRKADPEKLKIAQSLRTETSVNLKWIAERLSIGAPAFHGNCLRVARAGKRWHMRMCALDPFCRGQKASASLALLLGVFAALRSALGIAGALRKTDVSHIELLKHYTASVAFGIVLSMVVSSKVVCQWGWTCVASTDSKGQHRGENRRSAN